MYEKVEELLKRKGVSACKVARDLGLHPTLFYDWKSGKSRPKTEKLLKLADYFNVPIEYFLEDGG